MTDRIGIVAFWTCVVCTVMAICALTLWGLHIPDDPAVQARHFKAKQEAQKLHHESNRMEAMEIAKRYIHDAIRAQARLAHLKFRAPVRFTDMISTPREDLLQNHDLEAYSVSGTSVSLDERAHVSLTEFEIFMSVDRGYWTLHVILIDGKLVKQAM